MVVLAMLLVVMPAMAQDGNVTYTSQAKWLHELPHNTVGGERINGTLFDDPADKYLSVIEVDIRLRADDYYQSLIAYALVPMAVGLLGIISGM